MEFARKLPVDRDTYIFAVATMGGTAGGSLCVLPPAIAGDAGWTWLPVGPSKCRAMWFRSASTPPAEKLKQPLFDALPPRLDVIGLAITARLRGHYDDTAALLIVALEGNLADRLEIFPQVRCEIFRH